MYTRAFMLSCVSRVRLFATPWTVAHQAPQSMGFSRQEYWSGAPFPSPGDLPDPGIKPRSSALQADFLPAEPPGKSNSRDTRPFLEGGNSHGLFHRASHHMAACFSKTNIESQIEPHREKNRERDRRRRQGGVKQTRNHSLFVTKSVK